MKIVKLLVCMLILDVSHATGIQQLKISGHVIDSKDGTFIPYANITVLHRVVGTSSDLNGFFELLLDEVLFNDTLIISSVGYQSAKIPINTIGNQIFNLRRSVLFLDEVVVNSSPLIEKLITVEKFRKNKCFVVHYPAPFYDSMWISFRPTLPLKEANFTTYTAPSIEATFFPHKSEYGVNNMLSEVSLYMSNKQNSPSYFMLRLFKADEVGNPAEDLITDPIKIRVEKGDHLIRLDMNKYHLAFPPEGLFVGAELLVIEENRQTVWQSDNSTYVSYSPYLNYISSSKEKSYWVYIKGEWKMIEQKVRGLVNANKSNFYRPAISLKVKI